MWEDPDKASNLVALNTGHIEIGFGKPQGQIVGTAPLMCKIVSPYYPDGWFVVSKRSKHQLLSEVRSGFIPDWLRADCYEYHWRKATKNE